ncbi:MAG: SDR family NAD(P)-dependent oxidoreductase [Chitinophagaceae bacterium]
MTVKDKVAIVTGAGQGIGLEMCRLLAERGARVILNDIDEKLANEGAAKIHAEYGSCIAVPGDSSDLSLIQKMIDTALQHFGKLDIVIANAGITLFGNFEDYTPEAFYRVMQVNLGGTFFLAQKASNQMKKQGKGGALLFTSSVVGNQAHKNLAAYAMSKAAIQMLAKNLVIEISSYGINVNTIAPGATLTERTMEDKDYEKTWSELSPIGRPSTVKDIAEAAIFLVSNEARQITGQTLIIDGGWTCISPNP